MVTEQSRTKASSFQFNIKKESKNNLIAKRYNIEKKFSPLIAASFQFFFLLWMNKKMKNIFYHSHLREREQYK
jgi:hypothetical protein